MRGIELWWLGQASFRLRPLGAMAPTIFYDPYLSPNPARAWGPPLTPDAMAAQADLILITHDHLDHYDAAALALAAAAPAARFRLVVPVTLLDRATTLGLPEDRLIGVRPGDRLSLDGVTVNVVAAKHGRTGADAYTFGPEVASGRYEYVGYLVDLNATRIYLAGDTIPFPGLIEQVQPFKPHLAVLPINGRDWVREAVDIVGNLNEREAAHLAQAIGAQAILPTHYEMFAQNQGFPGHLVDYVSRFLPDLTVMLPGRGARVPFVPE